MGAAQLAHWGRRFALDYPSRGTAAKLPRPREVAALAIGAILVAALFVPHVVHGSFYNDGWQYLANYRFAPKPGFFGAVANFGDSSFRPGQMLYWPVKYALFDDHAAWHLAWSVSWAVAMSVALFVLLRQLGIRSVHAAAISLLVLIFPAADSNRLWAAADVGPFWIAVEFLPAVDRLSPRAIGSEAPSIEDPVPGNLDRKDISMDAEALGKVRAWLTHLLEVARSDPRGGAVTTLIGGLQALRLVDVLEPAELKDWMRQLQGATGAGITSVEEAAAVGGAATGAPSAGSAVPGRHADALSPPRHGTFQARSFVRAVTVDWQAGKPTLVTSLDLYEDGIVVRGHTTERIPGFVDIRVLDETGDTYARAGGGAYAIGPIRRWEVTFALGEMPAPTAVVLAIAGRRHKVILAAGEKDEANEP